MKFERVLMVLTLGLALGWGLGATSEPTKIGFVDAQQVEQHAVRHRELRRESRRNSHQHLWTSGRRIKGRPRDLPSA